MITALALFAVFAIPFGVALAYLVTRKPRQRPYTLEERRAWTERVEEDLAA